MVICLNGECVEVLLNVFGCYNVLNVIVVFVVVKEEGIVNEVILVVFVDF